MASLVLGAAGGFAFGPIGFLVGSFLGNLLFPEKKEGPKLADLRLAGSTYGAMIPIPYGTIRLAGQIVWQTDLEPHSHKSGGKGGPTVTTYTYTASFAVKVCKGPIGGFLRVWADSTLIYDTTTSSTVGTSGIPVTFYLGEETADPDPTMEATLGVGRVPAFRDDAAAVFTDWDLGVYGNRIPNLTWEVYTLGGDIPWRVASFTPFAFPSTTPSGFTGAGISSDGTTITITKYVTAPGDTTFSMETRTYDYSGTELSDTTDTKGNIDGWNGCTIWACANNSRIMAQRKEASGTTGFVSGWFVDGDLGSTPISVSGFGTDHYNTVPQIYVYMNGFLYGCAGGSNTLCRWPAPDGVPLGAADLTYTLPTAGGFGTDSYMVSIDEDSNFLWVSRQYVSPNPVANYGLWQFDPDLTLITHTNGATFPAKDASTGANNMMLTRGTTLCAYSAGATFNGYFEAVDASDSFSVITNPLGPSETPSWCVPIGNGFAMVSDGIICINPPASAVTLASIETDVSERCGLSSGDIDVSGQEDILVDGYLISQQTDGRGALAQLQRAYYVDAVESSGIIKFVNRGAHSLLTISDDDLAAYTSGDLPPIATIKRAQELDLPATVSINYLNEDAQYETGSQQATRQVTISQAVSKLDLAIAMTDSKARQIAYVLLFESWMQRNSLVLTTSRKYNYLEPTDVITAHGYTIRIIKKTDLADKVIRLEGVETLPSIYTTSFVGNATEGGSPSTPKIKQPVNLLLLDLPLITDSDAPNGFYAAMAGTIDDTWSGGVLYKSLDGTTYNALDTATGPNTIGTASTALGNWTGPNIVDEINSVHVVIGAGGGELSSTTNDGLLNGTNLSLLGSELLQYRDATLTAPGEYDLTGLLRARRGTEWAMVTHVVDENFVAFDPAILNPIGPFSELNMTLDYKAASLGVSPSTITTVHEFANTGAALRCYSPVQLGGGVINGSGDVELTWTRRTRIGGTWLSSIDAPLSEASESYVVQIWDASYTACARIIMVGAQQNTTYTSAQQVADFGAQQAHIYFTVGQHGTISLGSQSRGIGIGAGSTDDYPITPIVPFNDNPIISPPPSGGGTRPVDFIFTQPDTPRTYLPLVIGDVWVGQFTTGATLPSPFGRVTFFQFHGPEVMRHAKVTTDSGGVNFVDPAYGNAYGTNFQILFGPDPGMVLLATHTTYYITHDFLRQDGTYGAPVGSSAGTGVDFTGVPS